MEIHFRKIPLVREGGRGTAGGGGFERHIAITKSSLKKTLGKIKIPYVEMCTIISEVEGNMDDRPYLFNDTGKSLCFTRLVFTRVFYVSGIFMNIFFPFFYQTGYIMLCATIFSISR